MKRVILRLLGSVLGVFFIAFGSFLLVEPYRDNFLEKLNIISLFVVGFYFIFYGVTGRNKIRK